MEFLKEILGEELYTQFLEKVNAFNGDEVNKDKQIKIGNLASGDYVGKGKFEALNEIITGKDTELAKAKELIEQLKNSTKGNDDLQGKISTYEQENVKLQQELQEIKLKSAIKVALLSEKAVDIDYLTYKLNEKLKEKGSSLELDENENIKGWNEQLSGLKVQFPNMFESVGSTEKRVEENKLNMGRDNNVLTKSDILKKPYAERVKLAEENPEAYKAAMNE